MKFSQGNRKLQKLAMEKGHKKAHIVSFDLPAGHTCPGAKDCLSKVDRHGAKPIQDGPHTKFRCYAASAEAFYKNTRLVRWNNLDDVRLALRKGVAHCASEISKVLPKHAKIVRIHTSGDFFSVKYMQAWIMVCNMHPEVRFYGYTKSLKVLQKVGKLPTNFHLNVSHGGLFDAMIPTFGLPVAHVVSSDLIALTRGLKVDTTDAIACSSNKNDFALVIHGVQPKGGHKLAYSV